jgi:hypothetical protein
MQDRIHLVHDGIRDVLIKCLGDSSGNAGDGVTVTADGDRLSNGVFIVFRLQKSGDGLGNRPLTGRIEGIMFPDGS